MTDTADSLNNTAATYAAWEESQRDELSPTSPEAYWAKQAWQAGRAAMLKEMREIASNKPTQHTDAD